MGELVRLERYFQTLDLIYNRIDMINADLGRTFVWLKSVRGHGNVLMIDGYETLSFGHLEQAGADMCLVFLRGVRECVWALGKSGALSVM